jgi:anti-sigma factor RsiW
VIVDGRVSVPEQQPRLSARISAKAVRRAALLRTGLPVTVTCSQRCVVSVVVHQGGRVAGRAKTTLKSGGVRTIRIRMSARVKRVKARKFSLSVSASELTTGRLLGAKLTIRR